MSSFKIRSSQFCSLITDHSFSEWLKSISISYYNELITHLSKNPKCSENRKKMIEIQNKLIKNGKSGLLVNYLRDNHPYVLQSINAIEYNERTSTTVKLIKQPNEHNVFEHYNPKLLSFPQKVIFKNDNIDLLRRDTLRFCRDKYSCDYLILGCYSFVEYFSREYINESVSVLKNNRELYKYRVKNGMVKNII